MNLNNESETNDLQLKELQCTKINDNLTIKLYINEKGEEFLALDHCATRDSDVGEILLKKDTLQKVFKKTRFWFC